MSEWIACSERLPEYDTPVLVVSKHYPDSITAAVLHWEDEGWYWSQHFTGWLDDVTNYEFDDDYEYSHWMPLPKPPEALLGGGE